mmetsp:Transcript_35045/g.78004  ORF Transcript_35045/g.78004 Transcript_35045/m.78004 type:complete len:182 (+) Transcript_35045:113-658(+)
MQSLIARTQPSLALCGSKRQSCRHRLVVKRATSDQPSGEAPSRKVTREIGCSELYDMVSTTQSMSGGISGLDSQQSSPVAQPSAVATPSPSSSSVTPAAVGSGAGTSSSSSSSSTGVPGSQASSSKQYGTSYYAGLISSDIRQDNNASGGDMLKRSLQLAGGVALLLALLTAAFLKSNGVY